MPIFTKLGMVVTYYEGLPPIKSHYPPRSRDKKLGRIVTYLERLLPIESHDPLITWSCEST